MGQHADDAVFMCIEHSSVCDEYVSGNMSLYEAYEYGLIDSTGCEVDEELDRAWDRGEIPTTDNLNNQLSHALKDLTIATSVYTTNDVDLGEVVIDCWGQENTINKKAVENLYKDTPTCNICAEDMQPQEGKFGKFYYCGNRCKGQKTVSDTYWQSVKKEG